MKTITLLSLFLFFKLCAGNAQTTALPPVYEIKADTAVSSIPDEYWQMLADSSGKLTIETITKPPVSEMFHENITAETGIGYSGIKDYWQRLRLKNISGKDIRIVFSNSPWMFQYDLYVFRDSALTPEHLVNGYGVPYSQRDSFKLTSSIPVKIANGEEILIYKKLHSFNEQYNELSIGFSVYDEFVKTEYVEKSIFYSDTRNAFIAGILTFGFFLNIFFYYIAKEKVYLWYSLLLLFEGLWYTTTGIDPLRESPMARYWFDFLVTYSAFFFAVTQFVRYFLKTFRYYPRWDKLLIVLIWITIITEFSLRFVEPAIPFSWRGIPGLIQNIFFTSTMLALLVSFFFPKKEKEKFTNLSIAAAIPALLVWSFLYITVDFYHFLYDRDGTDMPPFVDWLATHSMIIEMFCVGWFAIVFSWILLQKYALLRKQFTQQALAREREKIELMNQQKVELENQVEERTKELKASIAELKTTQNQLIQSEKMASLGELTAGIAHEIQNPLNFVNNFSEVSAELVDEMKDALNKDDKEEAVALAYDLKDNLQKIAHHGKRADSIVKGMLLHSRASTGKKEPTDINTLVDEFLRLSYHGLRAKDKSFNAAFKTEFDESIGKVEVASQEVGRVLLNLFTNAFYSVAEKRKQFPEGYEPTLFISTKKENHNVIITVKDNGMGIPQKVLDKIYQPFFTTKPTGQGTGLGLSMSYDIIKAHGGEIKVKTEEGEGAEFMIVLPVNASQ